MSDCTNTLTTDIAWPCLLKLEGDDELLFVASYDALIHECSGLILTEQDCIIDSVGKCYFVRSVAGRSIELVRHKHTFTLQQVTELIQAHEFSQQQMCIIKIHFPSIESAILALK